MLSLPERVGSPLSLNSLREDLAVSHDAIKRWIEIFERLYAIYRIPPFGSPKLRAVKKEQKHYHFDWTLVPEGGARLENLVANHLLKYAHYQEDVEGYPTELRYYRDAVGREVDFVLLKERKPILFVEVKTQFENPTRGLRYLHAQFPKVRAVQTTLSSTKATQTIDGIEQLPLVDFLNELI